MWKFVKQKEHNLHQKAKMEQKNKKEDWMNSKWRPAMGWLYMVVCFTDFVLFPILWSLLAAFTKQPILQWQPLTLQGAGLFHVAMGAVLGIAAFGRTQEKISGTSLNTTNPAGYNQPGQPYTPTSYNSANTYRPPINTPSNTMVGYAGKKSPPPTYEQEI
jgi:hypothetical protein